jgi:hypothetical protein
MAKSSVRAKDLKKAKKSTPQAADSRNILVQIAEGALLAAVLSVLAFQELRFEGYENEKFALLSILAVMLLGINLVQWLRTRQPLRFNPIYIPLGILLVISVLSTLFSLSASRSFWGSPSRAQGMLSIFIYAILFWQALRASALTRTLLVTILTVIVIPLCLWSVISYFNLGRDRLNAGSTTGNANYLSSWLVMVLLFCVPQLISQVRAWKRPFSVVQWLALALFALMATLIGLTVVITSSRGALIGLGAAVVFAVVIVATLRQQKRLLLGTIGLISIAAVGYVIASRTVDQNNLQGFARILRPYDESRIGVWTATTAMLGKINEPFQAADGTPDRWVALRPFIGFGPDTTEDLEARIGEGEFFGETTYLDRFHNFELDTVATIGWLGLFAWIALYETGLYLGLRWLGLLVDKQWWLWLTAQAVGAVLGILVVPLIITQAEASALLMVGASVGAVGGLLFWIASQSFRISAIKLTRQHIAIISILCILIAQWIDNQFGFVQVATQPLFWILLGLLVALTSAPQTEPDAEVVFAPVELSHWYLSAAGVGLVLIHSMGISMKNSFVDHETGSVELVIFLVLIGLSAALLAAATQPDRQLNNHVMWSLIIGALWLGFFILKTMIVSTGSSALDSTLLNAQFLTPSSFNGPIQLLSLSGILLVLFLLATFVQPRQLPTLKIEQVAALVVGLIVGSMLYSWNFTPGVLHGIGNGFRAIQDPGALSAAGMAFEAGSRYMPGDTRLRLHWMYLLVDELKAAGSDQTKQQQVKTQIQKQMDEILKADPFYNNSKEWRTFNKEYGAFIGG